MKNLTLILLLMTATLAKGQEVWAPPGATWHYSYNNFWIEGYIEIKYIGDSLVDSKMCKVLEKRRFWYDHNLTVYDSTNLGLEFAYTDSNIVYYHRHGQFFKLYDFNSDTADYWKVASWDPNTLGGSCDSIGEIQVDSIDNFIYGSDTLERMYVSPKDTSDWYFYGAIVERIGSFSYMFPEPYMCIVDAFEGGPLRCYYDSTFGLYQVSSTPCDFIVGIETLTAYNKEINIYPNPTTTVITIDITTYSTDTYDIDIYSTLGQKLKAIRTVKNKTTIDSSDFPEGVYFITITDGQHRRWTKKIIKNAPQH